MTVFIIFAFISLMVLVIFYMVVNNLFSFNREYNNLLNELMDNEVPVTVGAHTCRFEGTKFSIWIGNYPYSYGYTYPTSGGTLSMRTRKRLSNYILTNRV